jgi:predicted amidohydrolase
MKAHLFQMDLAWEDKPANFANAHAMAENASVSPGDLIVLPEMFDTGFSFKIENTADDDNRTIDFARQFARELGATVHAGRTVRAPDGEHGLNRCEAIGPDGDIIAAYDKAHPFTYGREGERFIAGEQIVTYPWRQGDESLTVCPAICYDLRFPELFRAGLDLGAEAFVIGANWPAPRTTHWRTLAIARAIENQAFVFAANRVGRDPKLAYEGNSIAVDPKGEVLGELDDTPGVLSVEVDPLAAHAWREEFPAWRDRAPFLRKWASKKQPQ